MIFMQYDPGTWFIDFVFLCKFLTHYPPNILTKSKSPLILKLNTQSHFPKLIIILSYNPLSILQITPHFWNFQPTTINPYPPLILHL